MISDVLFEAIQQIRQYRTAPATAEAYSEPKFSARLDRLVADMETILAELDTSPAPPGSDTH